MRSIKSMEIASGTTFGVRNLENSSEITEIPEMSLFTYFIGVYTCFREFSDFRQKSSEIVRNGHIWGQNLEVNDKSIENSPFSTVFEGSNLSFSSKSGPPQNGHKSTIFRRFWDPPRGPAGPYRPLFSSTSCSYVGYA